VLAHVVPAHSEGLVWAQACVGEDGHERGVELLSLAAVAQTSGVVSRSQLAGAPLRHRARVR
jgi:hypothetical protein